MRTTYQRLCFLYFCCAAYITMCIGQSANLDKADILVCEESCGKFNNYKCSGNCTCGYIADNENGTCYDFSALDYNYTDYLQPTPTA
uniref:Evasin n=1 Tax=Rhipicephalus appendiculatus TaxID=34631 RepID=A0A131YSK2_RHIAP